MEHTTAECTVRPATVEDVPELARMRFELRAGLEAPSEPRDEFLARAERWMAERLAGPASGWAAWVAAAGDGLAGQVWLVTFEKIPNPIDRAALHAYLTNFYVRPALRNRGVGARLLAAALDSLAGRDIESCILRATDGSRSLYARHGFTASPRLMELRRAGR